MGTAQDDFGAAVVILDGSLDFNLPAFELANVAHLLEIGREHDCREGTRLVFIFAEIEQLGAVAAVFHVLHSANDALSCAHMLARFGKGDAVRLGGIAREANPARREHAAEQKTQS